MSKTNLLTHTVDHKVYWCGIRVLEKHGGKRLEVLKWDNLRFELQVKYQWYFRYRAALLQVKYPRAIVELTTGDKKPDAHRAVHLAHNRLRARKAKVTEFNNKLDKLKESWNSLFPLEEDPKFNLVQQKIEGLVINVKLAEKELEIAIQKANNA